MKQNQRYLGHSEQLAGAEFFRRVGGEADGTTLCRIRNGQGLEVLLAADRCADPAEVQFLGRNMGFLSPCGHRKPNPNAPFLSTFSAGFMTTCGLNNVGTPNVDEGEELPLHGTINNTPCHNIFAEDTENGIRIKATIYDSQLFGRNLKLDREYFFPTDENSMILRDKITNLADRPLPVEILYHCNMGYPLLDEDSILSIPSSEVFPRNGHAAEGLDAWQKAEPPQAGYEEMCFFHTMKGPVRVAVEQPKLGIGLCMEYDAERLPFFTQWKMMGERQYVMGLEPGNCLPEGRKAQREAGTLTILSPEETVEYSLKFTFYERKEL